MQDKKQIYYDYFQQKIFSEVQSFEIYRKKLLFKSLIVSIFLFLAGIVFAVSFIFLLYSNVISPIILPFLLSLCYSFQFESDLYWLYLKLPLELDESFQFLSTP